MGVHVLHLASEMLVSFLSLLALSGVLAAPETRFTCDECVNEMRDLGWLIYGGAQDIEDYLLANYCPTLEDEGLCKHDLPGQYVKMLYAIVMHYFVDGALHMCQTGGVCDAWSHREYTCGVHSGPRVGGTVHGGPHPGRRVRGLLDAELLQQRPPQVSRHCGRALPPHALDGHGEVYDSQGNLQPGTRVYRGTAHQTQSLITQPHLLCINNRQYLNINTFLDLTIFVVRNLFWINNFIL